MLKEIKITLLRNLNITLIKKNGKKFIILHSQNYFNKYFICKDTNIYFNKSCQTLVLKSTKFIKNSGFLQTVINNNNFTMINYFQKKIYFSGKSYKIKKNRSSLSLEFNKSHLEVFTWHNAFLKKLKKNKILLKCSNLANLHKAYQSIIKVRRINPFTQRGLRGSRCVLMKKVGKKST